jgi:hypothetical protein
MTGPQDPKPTLHELGANMRDLGAKLDRVLGQVSTINNRLDTNDRRIARTEKFQAGEDFDDGYVEAA